MTLGLVNIGAMHQAFGYIRKKIMDLKMRSARNRLSSEWLDQLVFLKCDSALFSLLSKRMSQSRLGLESLRKWNISVLRVDRLGLVSVL